MDPFGPFARMTRTNLEVSTYACTSRIWTLDDCMLILISEILHQDTVSERLRRWTRNPLGSARRGSNPLGVVLVWPSHALRKTCSAVRTYVVGNEAPTGD